MRTRGGEERAARPDLKVWKRREVRAAVEVNMEAGKGREVAKAKIEEAQKEETKKSDLEKEREVNQAIEESKRESKKGMHKIKHLLIQIKLWQMKKPRVGEFDSS